MLTKSNEHIYVVLKHCLGSIEYYSLLYCSFLQCTKRTVLKTMNYSIFDTFFFIIIVKKKIDAVCVTSFLEVSEFVLKNGKIPGENVPFSLILRTETSP